ncbi:MAG: ABC transporter ATP-binding protein [Roseitalea sp.]|jgi:iron complex transport system ATP-binding protein|nr:ABC transporter ATP-binding protein [Roseitalea sp.]MBO6722379.1 ABC transporter ATP-binding protein [Roseitalea sp.]MBO6744382.1 ABC transporter ATP-binding protein [Roseitalea sp.]
MSDQPAPLELVDVSFWPRGKGKDNALVANVSFKVRPGERVAIVGPNGAGKTTLIRMIAGLAAPGTGEVLIDGIPIARTSFAERARKIAYVGQSDEPDGRLTVIDYVALGSIPQARLFAGDSGHDRAGQALRAANLADLAQRRLDQLSGGERQRAKIARAICQRPSLLVLDEPTNHLDPQARGEQLSLVSSLGIPIVAALHDLTLIDAFADKVAVLADGRLQAFGPPDETLSTARVRNVFGVDLHRLRHPVNDYCLPTLDIQIPRPASTSPAPIPQPR